MGFFKKPGKDYDAHFHKHHGQKGNEPGSIKRYVMPELENDIENERKKIEKESLKHAVDTASKNRPFEKNDRLSTYLQDKAEAFSVLCNKALTRLQVDGLNEYKKSVIAFAKEEYGILRQSFVEIENKIFNKRRDVRDLEERNVYSWGWQPFMWLFIIIGLSGDLLYNAKALQAIGFNYLESIPISLTIVGCLAVFGYQLFSELKKDETEKRSNLKIVSFSILIGVVFIAMGFMRSYYMNEMNEANISVLFGTVTYLALNLLIFGGVSIVFHQFFPTKEQRQIKRELDKATNELNLLEQEKDGLIESQSALKRWLGDTLQTADDIMRYYNDLLTQIISWYRKVTAEWIKEVSMRLPFLPDCFKETPPRVNCRFIQIEHSTYLLEQKNDTNE